MKKTVHVCDLCLQDILVGQGHIMSVGIDVCDSCLEKKSAGDLAKAVDNAMFATREKEKAAAKRFAREEYPLQTMQEAQQAQGRMGMLQSALSNCTCQVNGAGPCPVHRE